jgi:hypothetical protein
MEEKQSTEKHWLFKEGNPGSPGRPSFRDMIEKVGAEIKEVICEETGEKVKLTRTELAVRAQFKLAEEGENLATPAFKALATHLEGTKNQQDNTSSDGSMTPKVTVYIPSNGRETERETETKQVDKTVDADVD